MSNRIGQGILSALGAVRNERARDEQYMQQMEGLDDYSLETEPDPVPRVARAASDEAERRAKAAESRQSRQQRPTI